MARPERKPPRGRRAPSRPAAPALRIVHEDEDVLVVDKPPGLLSATPPGSTEVSAFRMVKAHVRDGRGPAPAWIIHRLDREASGLMVFAKSEAAFSWLKEDFRARRVERRYLAVVEGEMKREGGELPSGTVQSFLREDRLGHVRSVPADRTEAGAPRPETDEARLAVTYWKALAIGRGRTLVELRMESGRKHQIRVHLSEIGHPIAGDARYRARTDAVGRLALHATELGFRHPITGEMLHFKSPASPRFWEAVGAPPPAGERRTEAAPAAFTKPKRPVRRLETSWDPVSAWYRELLEGERSDHHDQVIIPGTLRLLSPAAGMQVLDVACGEGLLCRRLAALGVQVTGIDASPKLIELARRQPGPRIRYEVADAHDLARLDLPMFDAVTCVMALMNIDPLATVLEGVARHLNPGGAFVGVILHPAFRAPRQTSWGTDREGRPPRRYRRVDGYLSPGQFEIVMNPGEAAAGKPRVTTWTFHRPLQAYVKQLGDTGFVIEALEEWPSLRAAPGGQGAAEENRIRREIPLFLGFRAVRR